MVSYARILIKFNVDGKSRNLMLLDETPKKVFEIHKAVADFNEKNRTNVTVVSPSVAHATSSFSYQLQQILIGPVSYQTSGLFLLNACIAYERRGVPLPKELALTRANRVVIDTGKYAGESGIALAVLGVGAHEVIKDGKETRFNIPDSRFIPVQIPFVSGSCSLDENGIPTRTSGTGAQYHFSRREDQPFVGFLISSGSRIYATATSSDIFGIVVEVPESDIQKVKPILTVRVEDDTLTIDGIPGSLVTRNKKFSRRESIQLQAAAELVKFIGEYC